uniref:Major sperm protein n=1 Tax=Parascaris univalens TaxID=6257 RepID=A0A915C7U5_PARUN
HSARSISKFTAPTRQPPPPPNHIGLQVYPPIAEFITIGGATKHVLTNNGASRLVIKIKCSNNRLYKVSPVYSFLDAGASRDLEICRKEGSARNDKLLIVYKEARSDETDPRVAFAAETTTDRLVLPLLVVP